MTEIKQTHTFPGGQRLEIVHGDITIETVDSIVNAANSHLAHGGGVARIISQKGGPDIQRESNAWVRKHGPVSHDRPAYTGAGNLPCRYVIHAVGPIWGSGDEQTKLAAAVRGSLECAAGLGLASIALPAISTGIFGFPKDLAARIFFETIASYYRQYPDSGLSLVRLTLYDQPTLTTFLSVFADWQQKQ
ncbi:MAG: macro domain-containing protein [Anaerolineaceae bacterium]|nr:macro domain-containing protein [Anaerolineaceae bacterium]